MTSASQTEWREREVRRGPVQILEQAQLRTTAMTVPYYVNEHQSDIRAIKPGWYGMENNGNLSSGPFLSQGEMPQRNLSRIALVAADH
jgi:hypothetical protein